jgi:hypothetical protein
MVAAGAGKSAVLGAPFVGPVGRGSATVSAYVSITVALGSGNSRLVVFSSTGGAMRSEEVARIVALGSNAGCFAINNPPSNVQNFCPSSGKVRLHFGQLFIRGTFRDYSCPLEF